LTNNLPILLIALFQSMFSSDRLPDLPTALQTTASATQALRRRITEGAPILRTVSINVDSDGTPVEYGRTWFARDRVTLTLNDD